VECAEEGGVVDVVPSVWRWQSADIFSPFIFYDASATVLMDRLDCWCWRPAQQLHYHAHKRQSLDTMLTQTNPQPPALHLNMFIPPKSRSPSFFRRSH